MVVNFTINRFVRGYLNLNTDKESSAPIAIILNDGLFENTFADKLCNFLNINYGGLLKNKVIINIQSPVPPGSGLGASSAVIVTAISIIQNYLSNKINKRELAEVAYKCERNFMGIRGGYQDHYSATFGGVSSYFKNPKKDRKRVEVRNLKLGREFIREMEDSMVLVDLNIPRSGEIIIEDQQKNIINGNVQSMKATSQQYLIAKKMIKALIKEDISEISELVMQSWESKKNFSQMISSDYIDSIIQAFLNLGAKGIKLTGAGGGGHLLIIGSKYINNTIMQKSKSLGLDPSQFTIVENGSQIWK